MWLHAGLKLSETINGVRGSVGIGKYNFFDVDYTIIRGSSGPMFVAKAVREGLFPARTLIYVPFFFLQYYVGVLEADSRDWHFSVLAGRSRQELEAVCGATYAAIKNRVFPQARRLIAELQKNGRTVVLATSSLDLIVRPLADDLGIEDVIATSLEFDGDLCTGRFVEGPLLKEKKKEKVYDYLRNRGADWGDCSFYSDSVNDLALLSAVAEPVVVNPDRRLRRIAARNGWRILKFRR